MNYEEVVRITKKLDKMVAKKTADNALDILNVLKKTPITLEMLQKTHIGMSVNNIRKQTSNEDVKSTAKQLIKSWKKLVPDTSGEKKSGEKKKKNEVQQESMESNTNSSADEADKGNSSSNEYNDRSVLKSTNDPIRDKCRDMILRGLQADKSGASEHSESRLTFLAAAIEEAIFEELRDTGIRYKNRIRSRYSNLKDLKNTGLRLNVLNGIVSPERLAKMTAEEMASDEMKKLRENYEEQNIKDHQMATNEGTKTDMFTCGKCKGKSCTYTQLQTRSSDEPMTTFVFCMDCGNRWKFC